MDLNDGYVPLFRKIIESEVWCNSELLKVWIWCLIRMNWEDKFISFKTGKTTIPIPIKKGQFVYGRHSAANELQMPESSVRNRMKKLEEIGNLDIKEDSQYSIITICNLNKYEEWFKQRGQTTGQAKDRQRTPKGQAKDTDNTLNNPNNINNIYKGKAGHIDFEYLKNPTFKEAWNNYLEMRKKKKNPATDKAQELSLKELHKYSLSECIKILERCIVRGWHGIDWAIKELNLKEQQQKTLETYYPPTHHND